jgi:hypothetical protein
MSEPRREHPSLYAVRSDADAERAWEVSFEAASDSAALIPEGEYLATVAAPPKVYRLFDSLRLVLTFEIRQSPHAGTLVEFIAQVRTGKRSRFREAWEVANGGPARRRDRMPLTVFRNRLFLVRVRTVTKDRFQRKRPRPYSIVDHILERQA